ncbi:site-specific integrase [Mesorhizobium sp.]|uniref:site-specific integrase n=1 Tax=Mesorhizobium sp. TaxID=1871066 RepID=UPI0012228A84|nr:site-specific integrase [Mesorhizobium sp.]TIO23998.1 MAG: site-specific integrase [Mesorhizobium sp.]
MATFTKLPSGSWRTQVRRKGKYASETFLLRGDAETWARETERRIDRGEPIHCDPSATKTFAGLIDIHREDLAEVGKVIGRSKEASLASLRSRLGKLRPMELDRERIIAFAKERAKEGAGPVTVGIDLGYIKTILMHAAAVHGAIVCAEAIDHARIALRRLGLVGKGNERDRRPTATEIDRIIEAFEKNPKQIIPVGRIVRFAVATALRQEEIARIRWEDYDPIGKMLLIRDRKDPRRKSGNHQKIPLLSVSGYDPCALIEEQRDAQEGSGGRIFPYNGRSVGTAFRRVCKDLKIVDLHFHDLRHEATSRLFEAGFTIEQVALVTGHRDWKMLRRYTHLRPERLHEIARRHAA